MSEREEGIRSAGGRTARAMGVWLFVFLCCVYLLTLRGRPRGGDEWTMLSVAVMLVETGSVAFPQDVQLTGGTAGDEHVQYSKFPVGQSLAIVPFYMAGRLVGEGLARSEAGPMFYVRRETIGVLFAGLLPVLATAGAAWGVFQLCRGLKKTDRASVWGGILYGLGTMAFAYSGSLLSEPLQALSLVLGVWIAIRGARSNSWRWMIVCGLCLGLAAVKPNLLVVAVPVLAYSLLTSDGRMRGRMARCALCVLGIVPGLAAALVYNWVRFGNVFAFGYAGEPFRWRWDVSIPGYLVSPGRSVFLYSPVLILAIFGARRLLRRCRAEVLLLLSIAGVVVLLYASWWEWTGGWCWGPRFLLPIIGLMMPMVVEGWETLRARGKRWVRWGAVVLVVCSILVQVPGVAIDPLNYHDILHRTEWEPLVKGLVDDVGVFAPHFSPLMGNAWLLKWALVRAVRAEKVTAEAMLRDAPWASARPAWRPEVPVEYAWPQVWYMSYREQAPGVGPVAVVVYLIVCASGATASGILLWRAARGRRNAVQG